MGTKRKEPAEAGTKKKKRAREIYADRQADRIERLIAARRQAPPAPAKPTAPAARPAPAPEEEEDFLARVGREANERCAAKRQQRMAEQDAAWAELRAAVARGETTLEEILSQPIPPIRLEIGTDRFELNPSTGALERAAPPAPRQAEVLPFRQRKRE